MSNEVEEARAVLRWAAGRSSIRAIADGVGVEQSVLNRFVTGKAKKPRPDVLAKLLPYVARRRAEYTRAASESATVPNAAPDGSAYRQIPVSELAYWRGVIETEHRHLHGLTQSMDALLGMLRSATDGIGGFIASGALPHPTRESVAAAHAELDALRDELQAKDPTLGTPAPDQVRSAKRGRGA